MSNVELNEKIENFLKSALDKFLIQNYNEAIRDLKAAEVLDRENPEILYNLGINYCRLGLFKTAIKYFDKVLHLDQTFVDILTVKKLLAFSSINNGDWENALSVINDILSFMPHDTQALNMLGYYQEKQGQLKEAIQTYQKVIEIDGSCYSAYNSIAYINIQLKGDPKRSLDLSQVALNNDNNNPAYLDTVGFIYMEMGKYEEAEKYLNQALEIKPFNEEIKDHIRILKTLNKK